ncbi:ADP-ribosylation factor-like protein 2-binding protein isoform X2 [Pithys albifrons albifrons]
MDDDFQIIQRSFLEKHYQEFDDSEENKLIYTDIFNEYISLVEKYIEEKLLDRIRGFDMVAFTVSLEQHKDEMPGDIFDLLLTFTDFLAFKEMFLEYRAEKEGRTLDLSMLTFHQCSSISWACLCRQADETSPMQSMQLLEINTRAVTTPSFASPPSSISATISASR